jgi:hypothetical protein
MTKKSVILPLAVSLESFTPSAFTPFLRRFTDERARDLSDTKALYNRVRDLHYASPYCKPDADHPMGGEVYGAACSELDEHLSQIFGRTIHALLMHERPIFEFPNIDLARAQLTLKEQTDLRYFLRAKEYFHAHEEKVAALITGCLSLIFSHIAGMLPASAESSPFTIPLIYTIPEPKKLLADIYGTLWRQQYIDNGLFVEVTRTMFLNMCRVSGIADPYEPKKPFKLPTDYDGSLHEMVEAYLAGTPLYDFFMAPVPLMFTHEERFSHMHVVGGSGAGKTQLLQNLILHDLQSEEPPALVIVDSQGDLIEKLSHLELFNPDDGPLSDRLVLISPKDIKFPPALNMFDLNRDRLGEYDEATKEQVVAGVIQTFDYLFTGLLGADLTAKQSVFFRFVARLMLSLPETMGRSATILDMIYLMDDPEPYREAIRSLPPIQRNFFERDFAGKTFAQTKEQIRYRLNAILENPTLARLFTAPKTRIDIFDVLNNGGIILVDTAKDFLKGSSSHFGRIFISLVLQAVLERAAIPERQRRSTFLIVDEAATYFDSNIDDFLTEARKYKCGCVFAHQFLDQATSQLRSSLAANTAIKFAGGVSMTDARSLAPDMRTSTEFILSQPKLHFAAHVRHTTPGAVSIPVEVGRLEAEPRMDEAAYRRLRTLNNAKVSIPETVRSEPFESRPKEKATPPPMEEDPSHRQDFGPKPPPSNDPSAASEDW